MSSLAPHRAALAGLASAALVLMLPASVAAAAPGHGNQSSNGNDGHIQIDGVVLGAPADQGNDNDPQVGCPFTVEFFGFDPSQMATITVIPWAPTSGGHPEGFGPMPVTVNGDNGQTSNGVGSTLDGYYVVTASEIAAIFSGVSPRAQGYHARIDVELSPTPTGQGDDKHHTIWITPCGSTPGGGGSGGNGGRITQTGGATTSTGGGGGNITSIGGSGGNGGPSTAASGGVTGATSTPFAAASASGPVGGATTVHTGMPWAGSRPFELGGLGAGLGLIGWGLELRRRARRAPSTT